MSLCGSTWPANCAVQVQHDRDITMVAVYSRRLSGSISRVLVSFIAQISGVMCNEYPYARAGVDAHVRLVRWPSSPFDSNCIEVRYGRYLLGHIDAATAAVLSLFMLRSPLEVMG